MVDIVQMSDLRSFAAYQPGQLLPGLKGIQYPGGPRNISLQGTRQIIINIIYKKFALGAGKVPLIPHGKKKYPMPSGSEDLRLIEERSLAAALQVKKFIDQDYLHTALSGLSPLFSLQLTGFTIAPSRFRSAVKHGRRNNNQYQSNFI